MPVFDITAPDGTKYEVTGPEGATEHDALAQVMKAHASQPAPSGPQPSMMDKVIASPLGRFAQDNIISPVEGVASGIAKVMGGPVDPNSPYAMASSPVQTLLNKGIAAEQGGYNAALSRNRNTPGYAAARNTADQVQAARGGSGLADQLLSQLAPALAGVAGIPGGFDAMNANADAQTEGQNTYRAAHPKLSTAANIGSGFLMGPERGAMPTIAPGQVTPSISQLRSDASTAYSAAHNSGVVASAPSYDAMVSDLNTKLQARGIDPTLHPNSTAVLKRLNDSTGAPIDFQGIDTQRRIAGHGIDASGLNKGDKAMSRTIQDHIDDYVDGLTPGDLVGGTNPQQAISDLNNARDLYSRSAKASTIQNLIDKAGINGSNYTASGYENALRVQFRKLANNDRGMARFAPAEQDAIKRVATGGSAASLNNALRYLGKFSPQGFFPAIAEMGAVGAMGPGALAIPAAGFAGRVGATAMTKAAAKRAVDLAATGPTAISRLPQAPLQIPHMTPQSVLPYGLPLILSRRNAQ